MSKNLTPIKGRGAVSSPPGRFSKTDVVRLDEYPEPSSKTNLHVDKSKTIITRNRSPDIPFEQSINPYKGCEHGCSYCYARETHAYLDHSPGRDFETEIYFKPDARTLLRTTLERKGYRPAAIALGANTDPYQPVEKKLEITRGILEELWATKHPVSIVTKGSLIERDLDLLEDMARDQLVTVAISVTTLDAELKRVMEPRAASPNRRLKTISRLAAAGVPVTTLIAPVIPAINDHEIESILEACANAGVESAGYVLIRLPHEVKDVFADWLKASFPDRARHVMSLIRQTRSGVLNDPNFFSRQVGRGPIADLVASRFRIAAQRHGLGERQPTRLRTDLFTPPEPATGQLSLL